MRKTTTKTDKSGQRPTCTTYSQKKDPIHQLLQGTALEVDNCSTCKSYFRVLKRQTSKYKNMTKTVQLKQI